MMAFALLSAVETCGNCVGRILAIYGGAISRHEGHNQATIQTLRVIKIDEHFKKFPTGGLLYPTMILTA
jgi:hypothetical protein